MKILEPTFVRIASGLNGAEGPVFDTQGNFYAVAPGEEPPVNRSKAEFVDGIGGKLYSVDITKGTIKEVCTPQFDGYGGQPAGCQSDRNGVLWVADMRLGLLKWSEGKCSQISKVDTERNALQGANDLVFDDNGNLWFTGPGSLIAPVPEDRSKLFKDPVGIVYCLPREENVPIKAAEKFSFCNGIAARGNTLLVAETLTREITAFDIIGPGKLTNRRWWANVPKEKECLGGPDGMDFDSKGQLLVANHGGGFIEVYPPDGGNEPIERIKCPFETPSNVHFKPGTKSCFVTEHDNNAIWKFEWEHEGMPMFCDK